MRDSRGFIYSSTLHGLILALLLFGLPDFFHRDVEVEPVAISVDILPIRDVSNIKPQEKTPEKEEKKPVAEKATERKAVQESKKEEVKPEEKPEVISAKQLVKKPEKKPEKKKPEEKKKQDDLSSVLKSIENTAKAEESKKPTQQKAAPKQHEAISQHYDPGAPLSNDEKGAIVQQIRDKWNAPVGAKEAVRVLLHIQLNQDGSVADVQFTGDQGRLSSDTYYYAAVEAAKRAVHMASPFKNLPPEKYNVQDGWREMEIDFIPPDL